MQTQTFLISRCRLKLSLVPLVLLLVLATTGYNSNSVAASSSMSVESRATRCLYELAGKLLVELNKKSGDKNVILSPVSIHQALSMLLPGSQAGSHTRRELLASLGYSSLSESEIEQYHNYYANIMQDFRQTVKETLASRLKGQQNVNEFNARDKSTTKSSVLDYSNMLMTFNKSQVQPDYNKKIARLDVRTSNESKTSPPETMFNNSSNGLGATEIRMMSKDGSNDNLAASLMSGIRMEALWSSWYNRGFEEFDGERIFYNYGTKDKPVDGKFLSSLVPLGGSTRIMEFTSSDRSWSRSLHKKLSRETASYKHLTGLNCRAFSVRLEDELSLTIFQPLIGNHASPSDSTTGKLNKLAEELFANYDNRDSAATTTNLAEVLEILNGPSSAVALGYLRMPRFKFENDISLKSPLQSIGLKRIFDRDNSELSNIIMQSTSNLTFIDNITHKATIESTKSGINSVAGEEKRRLPTCSRDSSITVIENPFMFLIRYKKLPLFVGQLTNL